MHTCGDLNGEYLIYNGLFWFFKKGAWKWGDFVRIWGLATKFVVVKFCW